jgi:hypothetical protein
LQYVWELRATLLNKSFQWLCLRRGGFNFYDAAGGCPPSIRQGLMNGSQLPSPNSRDVATY